MKILLWSDVYPPYHGGVETMSQTLARGLAHRGHSVLVVTSHFDEPLPDHEWDGAVEIRRLPLQPALLANDTRATLNNIRTVAALKRAFMPDLVHVQSEAPGAFVHTSTTAAWPCPTVLTLHGEVRDIPAGPDSLRRKLLTEAVHISAVSRAVLDSLTAQVPEAREKSSVIYNACVGTYSAAAQTTEPVVFAGGRLSLEKGFDVLLAAFEQVRRQIPRARLVLAGNGPEETALLDSARAPGLEGHVDFTGWLPAEAMTERMRHAAVVVVPSRCAEAFGLVALEAAMVGVPVVATRAGGLPEVVDDGVTGLLAPPENEVAMAECIVSLLHSPEARRRMGHAARARAATLFNPEHMLDHYEEMYRNALIAAPQQTLEVAAR